MTRPRILCIGAAAVDRKYRALARLEPDTSNPVRSERSAGGVARNVAENLARLGVPTAFASLVGEDDNGRFLIDGLAALGVDVRGIARTPEHPTAEYVAVLQPAGTLAYGLADMAIFEAIAPAFLDRLNLGTEWVFADCNLPAGVLDRLVGLSRATPFRLAIDAVSTAKVRRLPADLSGVDCLFLNTAEAAARLGASLPSAEAARRLLAQGAASVVLTLGQEGLLCADRTGLHPAPAQACAVADVTGAGDSLVAATLARLIAGDPLAEAARAGTAAAALTIASTASVRPDLSPELLRRAMEPSASTPVTP
jgi:pseudouridine kinase